MKLNNELISRKTFFTEDKKIAEKFINDLMETGYNWDDRRRTLNGVWKKYGHLCVSLEHGTIYTMHMDRIRSKISIESFYENYELNENILKVKKIENLTMRAFFEQKISIRTEERWESVQLQKILKKKNIKWCSGNTVNYQWTYAPRDYMLVEEGCLMYSRKNESIRFKDIVDWRGYVNEG